MKPVMKQNAANGMLDLDGSTSAKKWSLEMMVDGAIQRREFGRMVVSEAGRGSSCGLFSA